MLDEVSVYMTALETNRTIRVYLPAGYMNSTRQYPVLYMSDGKNVFRDDVVVGGVSLGLESHLNEAQLDLIVIGVDAHSDKKGRVNEYCPWKTDHSVKPSSATPRLRPAFPASLTTFFPT